MKTSQRIGVLLGGASTARESSLRAGESVVRVLRERGRDAVPIFVDRDVDVLLRQAQVDLAFLSLGGRYAEDGCLQGVLEMMGVPYTGSGVLASGLARNKAKAKEVLRLYNLPTCPGYVVDAEDLEDRTAVENHGGFGFPVVVKPACEGHAVGVSLARDEDELEEAVEEALRFDRWLLVERFIEGQEVAVAVLNGRALGAIEIGPQRQRMSSFSRTPAAVDPVPNGVGLLNLSEERYRSVLRLGTLAHEALGCEGASRVDLIVSPKGNEVILDVNTQPALTPHGLYARLAATAGLSYADLIEEILQSAQDRSRGRFRERRGLQVPLAGPDRRVGLGGAAH